MNEDPDKEQILTAVRDALLNKGDGYSIGQLVADIEGDGSERDNDPIRVWDRHFYRDVKNIDVWPDVKRDPMEVKELIDLFEEFWKQNPDLDFCQIVCRAHMMQNGIINEEDASFYKEPVSDLTDEQLREYLDGKIEEEEDD